MSEFVDMAEQARTECDADLQVRSQVLTAENPGPG